MFSRIKLGSGGYAATMNRIVCAALTMAPSIAAAEEAKPAEATAGASVSASAEVAAPAPVGAAAVEPVAAPEAAPAAVEPPPVEAPKPPEPEKPLFTFYGIIKPEIIVGASGVETFGKAIPVAPTAAAHPVVDPAFNQGFSSFQLQQTRVGVKIGEGNPLSGKVEIDFIDDAFSHSSPFQGAGPRLRLAYATYKPAKGHAIMVGQNWDIFSPLNAFTMNLVGNSFQAGNVAFLRPQAVYTYGTGEGIEIAGGIGMRTQNITSAVNLSELGMIPTFALQAGYKKGKHWFGASGIIGAEQLPPTVDGAGVVTNARPYRSAFAGNLFANLQAGSMLTLVIEAYIGQNTNSLGLLALGSPGGAAVNVLDAGGYLAAKFQPSKVHGIWLTAGAAGVLNADNLAVSYTPAVAATPTTPAVAAARAAGGGGIQSNVNLRATYVLSPMEGLQFYAEPYLFLTKFKMQAADTVDGSRTAFGVQVGTRYNF